MSPNCFSIPAENAIIVAVSNSLLFTALWFTPRHKQGISADNIQSSVIFIICALWFLLLRMLFVLLLVSSVKPTLNDRSNHAETRDLSFVR